MNTLQKKPLLRALVTIMTPDGPELATVMDSLDDVPDVVQALYTEKDGKFELTGIRGIKTEGDTNRLQESLRKEKEDHRKTKETLRLFDGLDAQEVHAKLDRYDELEAAAEGKLDEDKINELVEKRIKGKIAPLERENRQLKEHNESLTGEIEAFQTKDRTRKISDTVRQAASGQKVLDSAMDDVLLLGERVFEIGDDGKVVTKDGVGVTPGLGATEWLQEIQGKKPHWWPTSQGGGGGGGGGGTGFADNPWTNENWNMTEQGRIVRENRERADRMAKAAGTKVGGQRPAGK